MRFAYSGKTLVITCALAAAAVIGIAALIPGQNVFAGSDLGNAKMFAVLSGSSVTLQNRDNISAANTTVFSGCPGSPGCPGSIGGTTVLMGRGNAAAPDTVSGDVIASSDSTSGLNCAGNAPGTTSVCLGNDSEIAGMCVTGGGAISSPDECATGNDVSGSHPSLQTMAQANVDAASFSAFLSVQPVTQVLGPISLRSNASTTISATTTVNVISIPFITTGTKSTITINGSADSFFIFNIGNTDVQGTLNIGNGGSVVLTGGITPDHVVFNLLGSGSSAQLGNQITFNGTILAPQGQFASGNGNTTVPSVINGALLFGGSISLGNNTNLNFFPLAPIFGGGGGLA